MRARCADETRGRCDAVPPVRWRVRALLAKAWLTESLRKLYFSGTVGDVTDG